MIVLNEPKVVFQEIPDEISLGISVCGCPHHCINCHSPELWDESLHIKKGKIRLDEFTLAKWIRDNPNITNVLFLGGDWELLKILYYCEYVKKHFTSLKVSFYTGLTTYELQKLPTYNYLLTILDYLKTGRYCEDFGGLDKQSTNQRLYKLNHDVHVDDITYKFWRENGN